MVQMLVNPESDFPKYKTKKKLTSELTEYLILIDIAFDCKCNYKNR